MGSLVEELTRRKQPAQAEVDRLEAGSGTDGATRFLLRRAAAFVMMCGMRSWVTKVLLPCLAGMEPGEPSWRVLAPAPRTPAGNRARCSPAPAAAGEVGGLAARLVGVEEKWAYHSGICEASVDRFSRKDRAVMLGLADRLELVTASGSSPVLAALQHAHARQGARRDHVSSATWGKWAALMSSGPRQTNEVLEWRNLNRQDSGARTGVKAS